MRHSSSRRIQNLVRLLHAGEDSFRCTAFLTRSSTARKLMACALELSRTKVADPAIGALASDLYALLLLVTVTPDSLFQRTPQKRDTSEFRR